MGGGWSADTLNGTALGLPQTASFGGGWIGAAGRVSWWTTLDDGVIVSPRLSLGDDQSWTSGFTTPMGAGLWTWP